MQYIEHIPVFPDFYKAPLSYYWCQKITHQVGSINVEPGYISFGADVPMSKKEKQKWFQDERLSRKTFDAMYDFRMICGFYTTDFVVAMPFSTWKKVARELRTLTAGPRCTTTRVFLYLYYWAMRFQGSYSHSREQIVKELHINKDNLARALQWLEQHEFIVRTDYSKQEGYARRYYIPEDLWNYQCKKEWEEMQKSLKR